MNVKFNELKLNQSSGNEMGLTYIQRSQYYLIREYANQEDYVKNMLFDLNKENGIINLTQMVPLINRKEMKDVYLKILPVYLSYAEIFGTCTLIREVIGVIDKIINHEIFLDEQRLFKIWKKRLNRVVMIKSQSVIIRIRNRTRYIRKMNRTEARVEEGEEEFSPKEFQLIADRYANPIGFTDIDYFNGIHRWLKFHKLHKYLFFFANLSCEELENLSIDNIKYYERRIDIIGMTNGARNAILRKLEELKSRRVKLVEMLSIPVNYYSVPENVDMALDELNQIMRTPIRKETICLQESIANLIMNALVSMTCHTLKLNSSGIFDKMESLLKKAWSKYYFNDEQKNQINFFKNNLSAKKKRFEASEQRRQYADESTGAGLSESVSSGDSGIVTDDWPIKAIENFISSWTD